LLLLASAPWLELWGGSFYGLPRAHVIMTSLMGRLSVALPQTLTGIVGIRPEDWTYHRGELIDLASAVGGFARFHTTQLTEATTLMLAVANNELKWGRFCERILPGLPLTRIIRGSSEVPRADIVLRQHVPINDDDLRQMVIRNSTPETRLQDAAILATLAQPVSGLDLEEGEVPSIRRHRPGSLLRRFHKELQSMALPHEEWLVASGLDLFSGRTHVRRLQEQLLGLSRGAKVLPRTPIKTKSGAQFARFAFRVGEDEIDIVPELYSKLALYAAFRERDHALLMTLKGHAITWLKEHEVPYRDGYPVAFWTALLAWIPGQLDEAGMRVTASLRVQEKIKSASAWVNEGVSRHSLGLNSWWSPRYQLARFFGVSVSALVPTA